MTTNEELLARIVALEARCAALEEQVDDLRASWSGSMLKDATCPACGGKEILHVKQATQLSESMAITPLALGYDLTWTGVKHRGALEYFVCCACRLVETHATKLEDVERDGVKIVQVSVAEQRPPSQDPYR